MPIYDFKCPKCGAVESIVRRISERDRDPVFCGRAECVVMPPLGITRMERQPSSPAFTITGYNARNGYSKSS